MNRTPEDRTYYQKNSAPLFRAKRVICETNDLDGTQIDVHKNVTKVFYIEVLELRLICTLLPNGTMQLNTDIEQSVRDKYLVLMTGR